MFLVSINRMYVKTLYNAKKAHINYNYIIYIYQLIFSFIPWIVIGIQYTSIYHSYFMLFGRILVALTTWQIYLLCRVGLCVVVNYIIVIWRGIKLKYWIWESLKMLTRSHAYGLKVYICSCMPVVKINQLKMETELPYSQQGCS